MKTVSPLKEGNSTYIEIGLDPVLVTLET